MKRMLALLAAVALMLTATGCQTVTPLVSVPEGQLYTELGTPLEAVYFSGQVARSAWDVEMYNGRLYVGSGDYDKNAGPVYPFYYDFETQAWEVDTVLQDEQASRYYVIDDKLYVPGIDPKSSWDMGTYYVFDGEEWITRETLPNAAHNFDIIKHDGKLFAGLGAMEGCSPIVVTTDEETWTPVALYKDGVAVDTTGYTTVRVYDFFTLNGELYAYFYLSGSNSGKAAHYGIYRYDGEHFVYHSDLPIRIKYNTNTYSHLHQDVEFKGNVYLSSGYLYRTSDMATAEKIELPNAPEINDLRVIGNKLYALCSEEYTTEDGETAFYNSLQVTKDGTTFTEVFRFSYPVRALSFTYESGTVFLGMGFGKKAAKTYVYYEDNGTILAFNRVL